MNYNTYYGESTLFADISLTKLHNNFTNTCACFSLLECEKVYNGWRSKDFILWSVRKHKILSILCSAVLIYDTCMVFQIAYRVVQNVCTTQSDVN